MTQARNQQTIAKPCSVRGRGYWTGQKVCVRILPAAPGTGIKLIRSDISSHPTCPALVGFRRDTHLRTVLQNGDARFEMVEHVMAALYALEIDNCVVEIDGEEFPGLDGSSKPYVDAIVDAGLVIQDQPRRRFVLDKTIRVKTVDRWIEASPPRNESDLGLQCYYEYQLNFEDDSLIANQTYGSVCTPMRFARDIAPARTFVTKSQADALRGQGVAKHVTNQDLLVFGKDGPVENELRFDDECARHKTLDLIGDLALTGFDLVCTVVSFRGGHNLNGSLAAKIAEYARSHEACSGSEAA